MRWLNSIRRWLGITERPPATSADTKVLFALQAGRPLTFQELLDATGMKPDGLRHALRGLVLAERVRVRDDTDSRRYSVNRLY